MQTALTYRTNRDLFSNHYLDEHLPETEARDEVDDEEFEAAREEILDLCGREKGMAPKRNEAQLEAIMKSRKRTNTLHTIPSSSHLLKNGKQYKENGLTFDTSLYRLYGEI